MTQLAILSDIHGNLPALEAVLADLAQFKAQVMERVTREGWPVIRGNNEFYLLDYETPRAPAEWSDRSNWAMLPWLYRQLNGRWHKAIAAWPDTLSLRFPDAPPLRVVHGSPRSPSEAIHWTHSDAEIMEMLAGAEETTLVAGHTHLAMDRRVGRWHILNAGTVGVPLDGRFRASYMLLEGDADGWRPAFRQVPYDLGPLFAEFERQKFVEECGVLGHLVVEEFKMARLQLLPFILWRETCCPAAPFGLALLEPFSRINKWDYTPKAYHVNL